MKMISDLYLLVHPDYHARADFPYPLHPYQQELRQSWEKTVKGLGKEEGSVFFYVSPLSTRELTKGLNNLHRLVFDLDKEDILRIQRWRELLGDRMKVFPEIPLTRNAVEATLMDWSYDKEELRIHAFGEYQELCVKAWKNDLQDILETDPVNTFTLDRLSLSTAKRDEIWRSRHIE